MCGIVTANCNCIEGFKVLAVIDTACGNKIHPILYKYVKMINSILKENLNKKRILNYFVSNKNAI